MLKMTPMTLLKQDHQKLKALLVELTDTTERAAVKRSMLRQQIAQEILVHTTLEEELFYPAFKARAQKRDQEKLFYEAVEEHHATDVVLKDLMDADPGTLSFAGKAKVLRELIEHHAKEEEDLMFPLAKKLIPTSEHQELVQRMDQRKGELVSKLRGQVRKQPMKAARSASPN